MARVPFGDDTMANERLARTLVELADTLVDDFDQVEFQHRLVDRCMELLAVSAAGRVYFDLLLDQWNSFVFWLENLFS